MGIYSFYFYFHIFKKGLKFYNRRSNSAEARESWSPKLLIWASALKKSLLIDPDTHTHTPHEIRNNSSLCSWRTCSLIMWISFDCWDFSSSFFLLLLFPPVVSRESHCEFSGSLSYPGWVCKTDECHFFWFPREVWERNAFPHTPVFSWQNGKLETFVPITAVW